MSKIIYRETKGSKLTSVEVDENFRWIEREITKINEYCNMPLQIERSGTVIKIINSLNKELIGSIPMLIYRGSWNENTEYKKNDVVDYEGKRWIAIVEHRSTDNINKTNWEVMED